MTYTSINTIYIKELYKRRISSATRPTNHPKNKIINIFKHIQCIKMQLYEADVISHINI